MCTLVKIYLQYYMAQFVSFVSSVSLEITAVWTLLFHFNKHGCTRNFCFRPIIFSILSSVQEERKKKKQSALLINARYEIL